MSASRLSRLLARPLAGLVHIYRVTLSPLLGMNCRFQPTCSEYAQQALAEYGAWRGSLLACKRIARCHPWGGSGYDPVPEADRQPGHALTGSTPDAKTLLQRERVLNHAYGLISRGNNEGGFDYIGQYVITEPEPVVAETWFFHAMLRWGLGDAPLFYGQRLLTDLLDAGQETAAMKVCLRCLQENPYFRPRDADIARLHDVAERLGNEDVTRALPPR